MASKYATHKSTATGKAETLNRKTVKRIKTAEAPSLKATAEAVGARWIA